MSGRIFQVESNDGEVAILTQSDDRTIYKREDMNISLARFKALFPAGGEVYDPSEFDKTADVSEPAPITGLSPEQDLLGWDTNAINISEQPAAEPECDGNGDPA